MNGMSIAPAKDKVSAILSNDPRYVGSVDPQKEPSQSTMSDDGSAQAGLTAPTYTIGIGVLFQDLTRSTESNPKPVVISISNNVQEAKAAMLQQSSKDIAQHPDWSATQGSENSDSDILEIVGTDGTAKLRYGIEQVILWSTGGIERMHDRQGISSAEQIQPNTMYGVYWLRDLTNPLDQLLIYVTGFEEDAYREMREHATAEITGHVEWGATHESEGYRNLEIIGADGTIKLKYEICEAEELDDGKFRKKDMVLHNEASHFQLSASSGDESNDSSPVSTPTSSRRNSYHYPLVNTGNDVSDYEQDGEPDTQGGAHSPRFALYVLPTATDVAKGNVRYIQNYGSIGEAQSDMKMIAGSQLERLDKNGTEAYCRFHEDGYIDIVDQKGRAIMRYVVYEGRLVDGMFTTDELVIWQEPRPSGKSNREARPARSQKRQEVSVAMRGVRKDEQETQAALHGGLQAAADASTQASSEEVFCRCRVPDDGGKYVECSGEGCPNGNWLHLECAELSSEPKIKNWLCPECRNLAKADGQASIGGSKSSGAVRASAQKNRRRP